MLYLKPRTPLPDLQDSAFFKDRFFDWCQNNDAIATHTYSYQSCKYKFANLFLDKQDKLNCMELNPDGTWTVLESSDLFSWLNLFPPYHRNKPQLRCKDIHVSPLFPIYHWAFHQSRLNSIHMDIAINFDTKKITDFIKIADFTQEFVWHAKETIVEFRQFTCSIYQNCIPYFPFRVWYSSYLSTGQHLYLNNSSQNPDFCLLSTDGFTGYEFVLSLYFWNNLSSYLDTL